MSYNHLIVSNAVFLGVINLRSEYVVCEKDQVLSPEQAQILVNSSLHPVPQPVAYQANPEPLTVFIRH